MGSVYKLTRKSRIWWISYRGIDGKRHQESSRSERKGDAQRLLRSREGAVVRGEPVTPRAGRLKCGAAFKALLDDMTANRRRSIQDTERIVRLHLLPFFGHERRLASIGAADVKSYVAHRLEQKAAPGSVSNELAWLRRTFRLARENGDLFSIPAIRVLSDNNVRRGFFEYREFADVRDALPVWLQGVVTFAYFTGWRVQSEILPLTVERVDMDWSVIRLDVGSTKSGEGRQFFMTPELRQTLQRQLDSVAHMHARGVITPYVFHRPDGQRIKDFRSHWQRACKEAGVPGRLLHDFRRTAVRNMERAGVPRSVAMSMVGHKTEAIYRRYAIVDLQMQQEAAEKMAAFAQCDAGRRHEVTGRVTPFKVGSGGAAEAS